MLPTLYPLSEIWLSKFANTMSALRNSSAISRKGNFQSAPFCLSLYSTPRSSIISPANKSVKRAGGEGDGAGVWIGCMSPIGRVADENENELAKKRTAVIAVIAQSTTMRNKKRFISALQHSLGK